jgi:hypothetical protein
VPKVGSVILYANGAQLDSSAYTVNSATRQVTLKPGFTQLGDILEASYLYVEAVTEEPTIKIESVFAGYL